MLSLDYWGIPLYWAACEMWLEAVESVGYVDQELIRDALAAFEDDPAETILGETWYRMYGTPGYGGGNFDYVCHTVSLQCLNTLLIVTAEKQISAEQR